MRHRKPLSSSARVITRVVNDQSVHGSRQKEDGHTLPSKFALQLPRYQQREVSTDAASPWNKLPQLGESIDDTIPYVHFAARDRCRSAYLSRQYLVQIQSICPKITSSVNASRFSA